MAWPTTLIMTAIALAVAAISATELTESSKRDVGRGQEAAASALKSVSGAASPGYVMRLFRAEEKWHEKECDAFKLGFAGIACWQMGLRYEQPFLSPSRRQDLAQAADGWLFYSARATTLQMRMNLTDAQMEQLLGAVSFHYIHNLPGFVIPLK
jgi:hypothetical protein